MHYDKIRPYLKTGDIVLFSGTSGLSEGVKLFTFSKWSHVGIVFKMLEYKTILLFESALNCNVKDFEDNVYKKGVQLVSLSDRIMNYSGKVAIRQLNKPLTPQMVKKLIEFREIVKDRPYEKNLLEFVKSAIDMPFDFFHIFVNKENLSSIFCSELIAAAYQYMELLAKSEPSNEFVPENFSSEDKELPLLQEYAFMDEIPVE